MKYLILIILSLSIFSCGSNCTSDSTETTFTENQMIVLEVDQETERISRSIVDGDNIVFQFLFTAEECEDILDDEYAESLVFEIDNRLTEFIFINEEISQTNCAYIESGAWVNSELFLVNEGSISGERISEDEWEITVSITTDSMFMAENNGTLEFKERFKNKKL